MTTADDSLPPSGQALRQALESLVAVFDQRGVADAIIQHTRVRTTDDIDALS